MPADSPAPATTGLKLQTYSQDGSTIIQCGGKLTAEHSGALKAHVKVLIPDAKRIVIDLKEVTRMDSSGLGAIVGIYTSARKAKCEFLLINYNKSVKDLLGLTNLLTVFEACAQTGIRIP